MSRRDHCPDVGGRTVHLRQLDGSVLRCGNAVEAVPVPVEGSPDSKLISMWAPDGRKIDRKCAPVALVCARPGAGGGIAEGAAPRVPPSLQTWPLPPR